jgi:4-amino-4-deoxy-L-arabinose transferase-like glycosyltransferase
MKACPIWNFFIAKKKESLLLLVLVLLGLALRVYQYTYFPVAGETADELAWAMIGASLIQDQEPMSWSHFAAYEKHEAIVNQDKHYVRPALDHPPLFALIPGVVHALHQNPITLPSIKAIRLPMILLGVVNLVLIYFLAKKIFHNKITAYVAALIYALAPIFVFSSRMVLAENWLITLFLLTLIKIYQPAQSKKDFAFLGVISVMAILSKFSGLILPVSLILLGLWQHKKRYWQTGLISIVIGLGLFALYGAIFDWSLFIDVFTAQSARQLGLATVINRLFLHPTLVDKFFIDGWFHLGLISIFAIIFNQSKQKINWKPLISLFLVNLAFILTSVGEQTFHGWYDYLNYPFYVLASAQLIKQIFDQQRVIMFAFVWILLLPGFRLALRTSGRYLTLNQQWLRLITAAGFVPLGLQFIKQKKLARYSMLLLLTLIFISNILIVFNISHQVYWEGHQFFQF